MKDFLTQWADGNPGALMFLVELMTLGNPVAGIEIIYALEKAPTIRGTNLYVLWSDLCGKDMGKVETLCRKCPIPILEDACSRQDYSGRALVKEYLS